MKIVRPMAMAATVTIGRVRFVQVTQTSRTTYTSILVARIGIAAIGVMADLFAPFALRIYSRVRQQGRK
jgi:hypothetical protein